ncbi:tetrathionate reductase family octaheme c-type cytochrome [Billgrantia gudaonensis]|uniref:Octaheme c-type cytochrome, tetrathionate reductase family n=1 Tax=Billgrantia gudaonensis TaxID=376427 RepID=A0A1G8VXT5_9GAMM|nr:tetrathionate reductase family octaheme c-type cytochrome [Halomonas gudaonensis]SDJ70295.1 octaheme c-type cytochrome, tetrathionate reductase family [Halomonas gudaonensis]
MTDTNDGWRRWLPGRVLGLLGLLLASGAVASTADHTAFEELQGPFERAEQVTEACLGCHTEASQQVMSTRHWTWEYENPHSGETLGKKSMINTFCISDRSNEGFCQSCHVGYGWEDDTFDFSDESRVDCLACHNTGDYVKKGGWAGYPNAEKTDLVEAARKVGRTSRETCGACHFYGGGGDGVKHGDLDSSLVEANRTLDVHMNAEGPDFACSECHRTESHDVPGSRIQGTAVDTGGALLRGAHEDRNPATCQACHGSSPHEDGSHARRLNEHTRALACQTCHIPTFARGGVPTKMAWDWSTAGQLDDDGQPIQRKDDEGRVIYDSKKGDFVLGENVVPEYLWWNGNTTFVTAETEIDPSERVLINEYHGTPGGEDSRIWPVKRALGKQPYDTVHKTLLRPQVAIPGNDTAFWYNFDWDKALEAGTRIAGQPFSGEYDFVDTAMLWPITHMVAPGEDALKCGQCHSDDGRLAGVEGVWMPGRDRHAGLDRFGFGLAGLVLLGVLGHGTLRFVNRNRRKGH